MAKIIDSPAGGRRMIRLTANDILTVLSRVQSMQSRSGWKSANTATMLQQTLRYQPLYLPEDCEGLEVQSVGIGDPMHDSTGLI